MKVEIIRARYYPVALDERKPCAICGEPTAQVTLDRETGQSCWMHKACIPNDVVYPFPVGVTYSKNLKNSLGMGNQWIESRPSQKFFDGLSGRPDTKQRIDFSSHTVYMTMERAKREGLL